MRNKTLNIIGIIAVVVALGCTLFWSQREYKMNILEMAKNDMQLQGARWDLSVLFTDITDSKIDNDVTRVEKMCADFMKYKGKLKTDLPDALNALVEIDKISGPVGAYLFMRSSTDNENQEIKKIMSAMDERLSRASATTWRFLILNWGICRILIMKNYCLTQLWPNINPCWMMCGVTRNIC